MGKIYNALNRANDSQLSEAFHRAVEESLATPADSAEPSSMPSQDLPPEMGQSLNAPQERFIERVLTEGNLIPLNLGPNSPLLPFDGTPNRASEEYRIIRTKIFQHPKRPQAIVVSSPGSGDGKSVTAVNLAGVLSLKSDASVVLLDADFRHSSIAATLGLPSAPGLADVLTGRCKLESVIYRAEQLPNLYILPAGHCESNPAELLDSPAWLRTCDVLRKRFGHIVMDSPPIQAVADYELIQAVADGVVAVVRPDHTKRTSFNAALSSIPVDKLIGIVTNCVSDWFLTKREQYRSKYDKQSEHPQAPAEAGKTPAVCE